MPPIIAPGSQSSEFSLSKWVAIIGTFLTIAGTVLAALSQFGIGQSWVGVAIAAVGAAMKVLNSLGYTAQRTDLKQAALPGGDSSSDPISNAITGSAVQLATKVGDAAAARIQTDKQAVAELNER